jgi:hypothetical protein
MMFEESSEERDRKVANIDKYWERSSRRRKFRHLVTSAGRAEDDGLTLGTVLIWVSSLRRPVGFDCIWL